MSVRLDDYWFLLTILVPPNYMPGNTCMYYPINRARLLVCCTAWRNQQHSQVHHDESQFDPYQPGPRFNSSTTGLVGWGGVGCCWVGWQGLYSLILKWCPLPTEVTVITWLPCGVFSLSLSCQTNIEVVGTLGQVVMLHSHMFGCCQLYTRFFLLQTLAKRLHRLFGSIGLEFRLSFCTPVIVEDGSQLVSQQIRIVSKTNHQLQTSHTPLISCSNYNHTL